MATDLPDVLKLREIKYGTKTTPAERARAARMLLGAGRNAEALDLFMIAEDEAGVSEMRQLAVAKGRPILLTMIERDGRPVGMDEWRRAGDACLAAQRWREAYRGYSAAGDEEGLARVREQIPDFEIYVPQGK